MVEYLKTGLIIIVVGVVIMESFIIEAQKEQIARDIETIDSVRHLYDTLNGSIEKLIPGRQPEWGEAGFDYHKQWQEFLDYHRCHSLNENTQNLNTVQCAEDKAPKEIPVTELTLEGGVFKNQIFRLEGCPLGQEYVLCATDLKRWVCGMVGDQ